MRHIHLVRPLRPEDIPAADEVTARAFANLERRQGFEVHERSAEQVRRARARYERALMTDPGGAWVAEVGGQVAGIALALVWRNPATGYALWGLSLLSVDPAHQGRHLGRDLLAHALTSAVDTDAQLILSSADHRAQRRYGLAGFGLRPTVKAEGEVHLATLARPAREVHRGDRADLDLTDRVDRAIRGAPRREDLDFLLRWGSQLLVVDRAGHQGYCLYRRPVDGFVEVQYLAASDPVTAGDLLRAVFRAAAPHDMVVVDHMDARQPWALAVCLEARLTLRPSGAFCVRGRPPILTPYLPGGAFL